MRRLGKFAVAASLALCLLALAPTAGASSGSPAGAADASPSISVTQANQPYSWFCLPSFFALTHSVTSTPTQFILTIKANARPCNTVTAHAVIYDMPGNGVAWPQTLGEKQTFTINRAGTTTVVFEKHCDPVQLDVVTGATPQQIAPWGPWHGLPLFPFAYNETSQQYFPGPGCNPGGECDDYTPSQVTVNPTNPNAGEDVTVSGTGVPGDTITATLDTDPTVVLGTGSVDQNGQFSITGTIPANTPAGDWDISLTSEQCPTSTTVTITVGAVLGAENVVAELPSSSDSTGADPLRLSVGGVALILGLFALTRLPGRRVRSRSSR